MNIRKRLTILFVLLLAAIGLIQIALELGGLSKTLEQIAQSNAMARLTQVQNYLAELREEKIHDGVPPLSLTDAEAMPPALYHDGLYIQLSDLHGRVVNKSSNLGSMVFPPAQKSELRIVELPLPHLFYSPKMVMAVRPIFFRDKGMVGWIQVGFPLQELNRALWQVIFFQTGGWLLGIVLAIGFGYYFSGRALAPIKRITTEVNQWTESDLHRRLSEGENHDEIYELAHTFNKLFGRLENAFETQNRFVADASHELKSPLTSIKGNLQLLDHLPDAPLESRKKWILSSIKEVNRVIRIIKDLLDLAQEEHTPLTLTPINLVALGNELVEDFRAHGKPVEIQVSSMPLWVSGNEDRLRQVFVNLLENACRATQENGKVFLEWERTPTNAIVRVRDTGVGIPKEAIPKLFERFYRLDKGRSREQGGSGLGLSITRAIVESHHGRIWVESTQGEGSCFSMAFPILSDF